MAEDDRRGRRSHMVRGTHPTGLWVEEDGPFHRVRETLRPDFTLDNLLAKIAASEDKPADATTNTPEAQSQTCETKPICEEVSSEESHAAAPLSLPTSNLTLETAAEPQTCETKPISEGVSNPERQTASETCETKPICGGASNRQRGYTPIFRRRR